MEISLDGINGYQIIDLRSKTSYQKGHIPGSKNVPFEFLIIEPSIYLDKKKKYVLVCEYGIKSQKTSTILNNMGYHTYSLAGGIKKWLNNHEKL